MQLPFGRLGAAATNEPLTILPFHQLCEDAENYFRRVSTSITTFLIASRHSSFFLQVLDKNRETRMAWKEAKNHPYIRKMIADISNARITTPPFVPVQPAAMPLGLTFTIPSGSAFAHGQDPHPDFSYQAPDLYTPLNHTSSLTSKFTIGKRSVSTLLSRALGKGSDLPFSRSPTFAFPAIDAPISPSSAKMSLTISSKPAPNLFGRIRGWVGRRNAVDAVEV